MSSQPMSNSFPLRGPRFNVGDKVQVVGPSAENLRGNTGTVNEILVSPENVIYRYRVTFDDASSATFFGFELERIE